MKKRYIFLFSLLFFSSSAMSQENSVALDSKAIAWYFTASLNGESAEFGTDSAIPSELVSGTREQIWSLWHDAVDGFDEEKLVSLDILENRNSGSWELPSELEPNAIMPYYWGCNVYPSVDYDVKYPLFLYMHG